jgi:SnoaL-like protein
MRFAAALDRSHFDEARRYLAADCHYETGHEQLIGPDAIIASYRESAEWGERVLEDVTYESRVEETAVGLSVLYTDRITHHGQTQVYRCRQHLWFDDAGQIVRIVHEELPGERERLDGFLVQHGLQR